MTGTPRKGLSLQGARTMWLIYLCSACGFILFAHLLHKPHPHVAPRPAISWAIAAVGVVEIVFFAYFRRTLLAKSQGKRQMGETAAGQSLWALAQLYGFASALSIVLFGLVLSVIGAPPPWISTAFFVAGIVNLAVYRPQLAESP
jgi:hypothetical protein